jgi:hypothetical protein
MSKDLAASFATAGTLTAGIFKELKERNASRSISSNIFGYFRGAPQGQMSHLGCGFLWGGGSELERPVSYLVFVPSFSSAAFSPLLRREDLCTIRVRRYSDAKRDVPT